MPGTTSYLVLAIAQSLSVKLAEIGCKTIQSVKVRVHQINADKFYLGSCGSVPILKWWILKHSFNYRRSLSDTANNVLPT